MYLDEENPTGDAPNTDNKAKPIKFEAAPAHRNLVRVTNALYRNAVFSGVFVVAESKDPNGRSKDGHETIEVECTWYGWKPKTRWIRITVPNAPEYLKDYTGDVVKNLGK